MLYSIFSRNYIHKSIDVSLTFSGYTREKLDFSPSGSDFSTTKNLTFCIENIMKINYRKFTGDPAHYLFEFKRQYV